MSCISIIILCILQLEVDIELQMGEHDTDHSVSVWF